MEREQAELAPKLAVVALLGLFNLREVRLQILVGEERGAVDALHRLIARVAFPVRIRRAQQLERLQLAGRRDVGADAEINERFRILDCVAGHFSLPCSLLVDQLHLKQLAPLREERLGLVPRPHLALVGQIFGRQILHLLLDGVEILGHERTIDDEVVEETFVGRGSDAALRSGEELRHRRRQQMRAAVPVERQRFRAAVGDDADRGIFLERAGEIDERAVDDCRKRGFGEAR